MRVKTQISAFIANRAGTLAALAADLARHAISIQAVTIATLADHAVVRLVVSDTRKALHLLGERGVLVVSLPILAVDIPDEAGEISRDFCFQQHPPAVPGMQERYRAGVQRHAFMYVIFLAVF